MGPYSLEESGKLTNLRVLELSNNEFLGTLPSSMGQLVHLETLALDDNRLWGSLSLLNTIPSLEQIYLANNQFIDVLGDSFLATLPNLIQLDLSGNDLRGSIPGHIFNGRMLQVLDLNSNKLIGGLPKFAASSPLEVLSLYSNQLTGAIPESISNAAQLKFLDVSRNQLEGDLITIASSISSLTNLEVLFLSNNLFSSSLPLDVATANLSNLSKLKELSLRSIDSTGPIPSWITSMPKLQWLDLGHNAYTGSVPSFLGELTDLNFVLLNSNNLTGTLDESLSSLTNLGEFRFVFSAFGGANLVARPALSSAVRFHLSVRLQYLTMIACCTPICSTFQRHLFWITTR